VNKTEIPDLNNVTEWTVEVVRGGCRFPRLSLADGIKN